MLEKEKKFLDQKGIEYLWSKINMQDYPNNDTLVTIINAIDDGKMDKTTAIPLIEQALAGQVPVVKSVDENGKPVEWEAQDFTKIPETTESHQYLTTNENGEKVWEEKLGYLQTEKRELVELVEDAENYGFMLYAKFTPNEGDQCLVILNGVEYHGVCGPINMVAEIFMDPEENCPYDKIMINCSSYNLGGSSGVSGSIQIFTTSTLAHPIDNRLIDLDLPIVKGKGSNSAILNDGKALGGHFAEAEGLLSTAINQATALGESSLAINDGITKGRCSFAQGNLTIATGKNQAVFGQLNTEDTESTYALLVGNGVSSSARSNAHSLDWDGNAWYAGDVYVGSTSGANRDEGSKKLATEDYVESLYKKLSSNTTLGFYCIEDVTIITDGISKVYPANSNIEIKFVEGETFEIVPTSNNSILSLTAFPGALGTYYPWLEGVKQFSNILFDMNPEDMYTKWNQGNQGSYQVQYAQYTNCVFWSDNPYISELSKRTNYTLYYSSQLPLCYSSIPENTFKAFYLAFGVNSDPNWGNKVYRDSFAQATYATQVFSYYGARTIGIFGHDDPDFNIILPPDCRGLMSAATAIENAGTFDAINVTNFGAKSGSWRDAFGWCGSLRNLYIKNLKVNLNVSWSPLEYDSIYFIISTAANTKAITISVSPYTYNLLGPSDFELATSKNITIALLTTNYVEDKRLTAVGEKIKNGATLANSEELHTVLSESKLYTDNAILSKADTDKVLLKTEQTLTEEELTQVRANLKTIGKDVAGLTFTIDEQEYVASTNAEIFGDYENNIAVGQWSIAEGSGTVAKGRASHAEGAFSRAMNDGCHVEGYQTEATGYWSHAEGEMTRVTSYASHAEGSYCTMPDKTKRYGTASGYASHVEGGGCHAIGSCSHVEGLASTASGNQSHAEGRYTIAAGGAQHVEGVANIEDAESQYIHIAGNGTWEQRSNAHTLDWNGNAWFAGDIYVGSASGINKDEGSLKLTNTNDLHATLAEAKMYTDDAIANLNTGSNREIEATSLILKSSTEGSNKRFRITIDDDGVLTATEVV